MYAFIIPFYHRSLLIGARHPEEQLLAGVLR